MITLKPLLINLQTGTQVSLETLEPLLINLQAGIQVNLEN
jgi:hypothetical protein